MVVSVPVLSEQITEVQPRVSTEGRLLTMAFFLAILRVPSARQVVMTAGRPSGMAATARLGTAETQQPQHSDQTTTTDPKVPKGHSQGWVFLRGKPLGLLACWKYKKQDFYPAL